MTDIWQAALSELETKVSSHNFESWFKNIAFHHQEGRVAHLEVGDEFFKAWIEENYIDLIEESISTVSGTRMRVVIHIEGALPPAERRLELATAEPMAARELRRSHPTPVITPAPAPPVRDPQTDIFARIPAPPTPSYTPAEPAEPAAPEPVAPTTAPAAPAARAELGLLHVNQPVPSGAITAPSLTFEERIKAAGLNPRYTFDEFVVGPSNQFTHAACVSIAKAPGTNYNPLFIFGGVGLGKTHLLQAVGIEILRQNPEMRVINLSSEEFMNELINGLRARDMNAFRAQYRNNCDVLLIDDIQFIGGKDSTQEEFFHTFNALHQTGKQIVITSDKPPKDLPGIEERLQSRFSWGLIADVQPPEIETRLAILEKKAEDDGMVLDKEVGMLLASSIRSNVRELEGTLVRLGAQASLMNHPITVEMARQHLRRMNIEQSRTITVERVITIVADFFNISGSDIRGSRRTRTISEPRQYAMYLSRKLTDHSYPEIGRMFGGKDHTTVLAACRKLEKHVESNGSMAETIIELQALLER